jgi:hypothetical protein
MALGIEITSGVFMDPHVEFNFALDNGFIKAGKQHVVFIVDPRLRRHKQSVIFPGIAMDDRGTGIGSGPVRPEKFTAEAKLQVYKLGFIKVDIAHGQSFSVEPSEILGFRTAKVQFFAGFPL